MKTIITGAGIRRKMIPALQADPWLSEKRVLQIERDLSGSIVTPDRETLWRSLSMADINQKNIWVTPPSLVERLTGFTASEPFVLIFFEAEISPREDAPIMEKKAHMDLKRLAGRLTPEWAKAHNVCRIMPVKLKDYYEGFLDEERTYGELAQFTSSRLKETESQIAYAKKLLLRAMEAHRIPVNPDYMEGYAAWISTDGQAMGWLEKAAGIPGKEKEGTMT